MRRQGNFERFSGDAFITQISHDTASALSVPTLIKTIADLAKRRDILRTLDRARESSFDLSIPATDLEAWIRDTLDQRSQSGPILGKGTTAAALCQNPPEVPPELISGVLYTAGTMMLSGPSKTRKTYTFLDLGLSVATGMEWIGFATTQAPVIYLNFELAEHSFQRRLTAICAAKGTTPPSNFHSYNLRGQSVTLAKLEAELPRAIRTHGAKLVIVDPWYKISARSGAEENSNDEQARVLDDAQRIVSGSGAALVVGHHFAKGDPSAKNSIDRAAGAGAMARWGDVIATLTELQEDNTMVFEFHLRDFAPVEKFAARWMQPLWQRDEALDPAKLRKIGRSDAHPALELLALLKDGMSNKEWQDAVGWPETTYRTKRDQLIKERKVRLSSGCYYKDKP